MLCLNSVGLLLDSIDDHDYKPTLGVEPFGNSLGSGYLIAEEEEEEDEDDDEDLDEDEDEDDLDDEDDDHEWEEVGDDDDDVPPEAP
jgi:hypothetical protein